MRVNCQINLTKLINQPGYDGCKYTAKQLRDHKGMLPLDVPLITSFLHDQNHFVCLLSKIIYAATQTKKKFTNPSKHFAAKFKFTLLITMTKTLGTNGMIFQEFAQQIKNIPEHLFDNHKGCLDSCKRKNNNTFRNDGRYLCKKKIKLCTKI